MNETWTARMRWLVIGLSGLWALLLVVAVLMRVTFPLELEWMEDGSLHQALRLRNGEPIYAEPSEQWIPYLYTPFYPATLAVLSFVFPLGFALGRAVSILSAVAMCVAMWRIVAKEGKPLAHRALAVGLFCAGFIFSFRWLDVARGDALFMALTIWALLLLRYAGRKWAYVLLAGILMALAFWTKQTAFVFIFVSGLAGLFVAPRRLWIYVLAIGLIDGVGVLVGQELTDGWLWTYIYELHQSHKFSQTRLLHKTWRMFLHASPFLAVLSLGLVFQFVRSWLGQTEPVEADEDSSDEEPSARRRSTLRERLDAHIGVLYWGVMCVAGLGVSALGYATQWAEPNAFIPGVCFGAIFIAVAMPSRGRLEGIGLVLVALQMVFSLIWEPLYYPIKKKGLEGLPQSYALQDAWRTVPHPDVRRRAQEHRERLESVEGELLALQRPWWNVLAGGDGHVGSMGLHDVPKEQREKVRNHVRRQVREEAYEVLWFEGDPQRWIQRDIAKRYVVGQRLHGEDRIRPLVGYMSDAGMVKPYKNHQLWLVRPRDRTPPEGTTVVADFEKGRLQGFTTDGPAFGRRPIRSVNSTHAAMGPLGGFHMLSSGARSIAERAEGTATSPVFELPAAGGSVQLLVGTGTSAKGVRIEIVEDPGTRTETFEFRNTQYSMRPFEWVVPDDWAGREVRLRVVDEDTNGLIAIDDLWLVPAGATTRE